MYMFISPTILTLSLMFYTVTAHSIKMCWSKFNPSTYVLGLQQYKIKHSIQFNFWIPRENCISTHHRCIPDTTTAIETANLFFILQFQLKGNTSDMQGNSLKDSVIYIISTLKTGRREWWVQTLCPTFYYYPQTSWKRHQLWEKSVLF